MQHDVFDWTDVDIRNINLCRGVALDILAKAGSGHPGATLTLISPIYLLLQKIMAHNPAEPSWPLRDRLVLSCGHASLALYLQLHIAGYDITNEDLFDFRKLGSKTPGHPEFSVTPGIETTTGPLGQGLANAVGMALSLKIHEQESKSKIPPRVYCVVSDGDLQEGISFEAASIAVNYRLDNLVVIFDSNEITIDGPTHQSISLDMQGYFQAIGWRVSSVPKMNSGDVDMKFLAEKIFEDSEELKPLIIFMHSEIGWPSPNYKSKAFVHGNLLPEEEIMQIKRLLDIEATPKSKVPSEIYRNIREGNEARRIRQIENSPENRTIQQFDYTEISQKIKNIKFSPSISTRKANGQILNVIKEVHPWTIGGSADLTESNGLSLENLFTGEVSREGISNNLIFGVREHAMSAISNGIARDSMNIVYCATYLGFSDYQKPAVRLSALMGLPVTYLWTHDSIALGADGPTHQPIEQLATLRSIPQFSVIRPGSAEELKLAWLRILKERKPAGLILSRQDLDNSALVDAYPLAADKGGYIYSQNFTGDKPELVLIATGSELSLAKQVCSLEAFQHVRTRVVSMPCWEWFTEESTEYRERVLPKDAKLFVSLEAGSTFGWEKFTGRSGLNIGIDTFGASGNPDTVMEKFGFTVAAVEVRIREKLHALESGSQ
jgi:transketolase